MGLCMGVQNIGRDDAASMYAPDPGAPCSGGGRAKRRNYSGLPRDTEGNIAVSLAEFRKGFHEYLPHLQYGGEKSIKILASNKQAGASPELLAEFSLSASLSSRSCVMSKMDFQAMKTADLSRLFEKNAQVVVFQKRGGNVVGIFSSRIYSENSPK